jgi:hypothetical protein
MPEKYTYRSHRDLVYYRKNRFNGSGKKGSLVERNALGNVSIEEETILTPEQLKEIEENDYWTPLCGKILPETDKGITQDDIISSLEHGKLPGGFSFNDFVTYVGQDDLDKYEDI